MEADALRRPPAALPGNQLEIGLLAGERPHQQRLENALLADRLGKGVELGLGEAPPRLECPGPDQLDRHPALRR